MPVERTNGIGTASFTLLPPFSSGGAICDDSGSGNLRSVKRPEAGHHTGHAARTRNGADTGRSADFTLSTPIM